jgi:cytoskeletal protein RodZ
MSRKSKRCRNRQPLEQVQPGHEAAESFEFLDDLGAPAPAGSSVPFAADARRPVTTGPSEPAVDSSVRVTRAAPDTDPAVTPTQAVQAIAAPAEPCIPKEPVRTLGEILTAAREASGLSVEEASARTRIPAKMIQHLENDRFGEFAAEAYARGSLRAYGGYLGLDVATLLGRYEALRGHVAEPAAQPVWEPLVEPVVSHAELHLRRRPDGRRLLLAGLATLAVVAVAAGAYLVRRGVVHLRPEAGLTQIENELRQTRAPDNAAHEVVRTAARDSVIPVTEAPGAAPPRAGFDEDTSPPPSAVRSAATHPAPAAVLAARATAPPPRGVTSPGPATAPPGREVASPITDLVEEPLPEEATEAASALRLDPLVLTAAARDTCSLRLQIDADGGRAAHIHLQPGEARSWTARASFRIAAGRGSKVDLWLNGRPIVVPGDGRALRIDRGSLQALTAEPARAAGGRGTRRHRRAAARASAQAPAAVAAPSRTHAPGPLP